MLGCEQANVRNPHDTIQYFGKVISDHTDKIKALYGQGLSLREIESRIGISKTKIRTMLIRANVPLRPTSAEQASVHWRTRGKRGIKPPYGYCYLEGQIVKNPRMYPILLHIIERWKSGHSLNSIATWLNGKGIPSPMCKKWSWNSVNNVILRHQRDKKLYKN